MSKNKERSELEFLRGQLRNLRSEIKHLKKELGRYQKASHLLQEVEEKSKELELEKEYGEKPTPGGCPDCKTGTISSCRIGDKRILYTCNNCSHRRCIKR